MTFGTFFEFSSKPEQPGLSSSIRYDRTTDYQTDESENETFGTIEFSVKIIVFF